MDDRSCQPSEDMLRSLEVEGWEEWLARLDKRLERPVSICGECRMAKGSKVFFIPCFFIPCFFMPPEKNDCPAIRRWDICVEQCLGSQPDRLS